MVWAVAQSAFMHDTQCMQARCELFTNHGRAVIGKTRPGQSSFGQRLTEPVHQ